MWPFHAKDKDSFRLVCDIGTGSVGAAIVKLRGADRKPVIIDHVRASIPVRSDTSRLFEDMIRTLEDAVQKLHQRCPVNVDRTHAVVAGAWYDAEIVHVSESFEKPIRLTKRILENMIAGVHPVTSVAETEDQVIERNLLEARVNGYTTPKPWGHRIRQVDLVVQVGTMSSFVMDAIRDSVRTWFASPLTYMSFGSVSYQAHRHVLSGQDSALMLDVGGEVTDAWYMHEGVPAFISTVPSGTHTVVRGLATRSGMSLPAARSVMRMGHAAMLDHDRTEKAVMAEVRTWLDDLSPVITALEGRPCETIILIIDNDHAGWWQEAVQDYLVKELRVAERVVVGPVRALETSVVYDVIDRPRDMFLSLEALVLALLQ